MSLFLMASFGGVLFRHASHPRGVFFFSSRIPLISFMGCLECSVAMTIVRYVGLVWGVGQLFCIIRLDPCLLFVWVVSCHGQVSPYSTFCLYHCLFLALVVLKLQAYHLDRVSLILVRELFGLHGLPTLFPCLTHL